MSITKLRKRWKPEELQYLIDNYSTMKTKDIANHLTHPISSVYTQAYHLNLQKPEGSQRNNNVEILLNGSLQSLYWIGFLLADGTFHKTGNMLRLDLSIKDLEHFLKFKDYIRFNRPY